MFVDFTAAWCVTCQVNKRLVLNDADGAGGLRRSERRAGARRLDAARPRHHRRRWPRWAATACRCTCCYRPGKEPLLLPEVLQPGDSCIDALARRS